MNKGLFRESGFTLIEILITLGILALLAALVVIAINPLGHFRQANNLQRRSDLKNIMDAIDQNIIGHAGKWDCPGYDFPVLERTISSADYDICSCLVPNYIGFMPTDPTDGSVTTPPCTNYNTGYNIVYDSSNMRLTLTAPSAEGVTITLTR